MSNEPYPTALPNLRVEVEGRSLTFDSARPLRIGRASDNDITLAAMSVSRNHAELRPDPTGWLLVDAGGQLGTYVDGRRITELVLASGSTTVQCGPPGTGSSIVVTVEGAVPPPAASPPAGFGLPAPPPPSDFARPGPGQAPPPFDPAAPSPAAPPPAAPSPGPSAPPAAEPSDEMPPGFEPTYVLASPLPGLHPGEMRPRTGPDLMVEAEGQEHRFRHPDTVTIGRLPDSAIVITDPVASRMHLRVDPTAGGWGFTNLSREGTFLDGRRVESQAFDETVTLRLGHPTAGPELVLVPVLSSAEEQARLAKKRTRRRLVGSGVAIGAFVVLIGLIAGSIALFGGDDTEPVVAADPVEVINEAKAKTVLFSYEVTTFDGQRGIVTGSGSIISPDGLILTNAHVAAPAEPELEEVYGSAAPFDNPEYLDVQVTDPDDDFRTTAPSYRARVVQADGSMDAAVVQIYADAEGNEIDPADLDLPYYDLGDSDVLETGDSITVLGFPGIARAGDVDPAEARPEVTVTTGVISTFIDTTRLGPRSEFDTDARISQGNSGGSAINADGELIGIPSATFQTENSAGYSGRVRPIEIVRDLIESAEETAGSEG